MTSCRRPSNSPWLSLATNCSALKRSTANRRFNPEARDIFNGVNNPLVGDFHKTQGIGCFRAGIRRLYAAAVGGLSQHRATMTKEDYDKLLRVVEDSRNECERARKALGVFHLERLAT